MHINCQAIRSKVHTKVFFVSYPIANEVLSELNIYVIGVLPRERSTFLNLVLSASTQVAGFSSYFLKVCKHHHAILFYQWHLPFSVQSDWYVLPLVFATSYLPTCHNVMNIAMSRNGSSTS